MNMEFMKKFKPEENALKDFKHWIVVIREKQVTLGDAVIILKRNIPSMAEMAPEEAAELPIIAKWYEERIKSIYPAEKFNYVAAMMKDNFVHFHVFPRYSKNIMWYGINWADEEWPRVIKFKNVEIPRDVLDEIKADIRENVTEE